MTAGAGAAADMETATRYLRGELDDLDRAVFEERFLGDEAVYQAVLAAEDELLDAHVAGALDGEMKARLDARLKVEPELRRRRQLAAGLFARAAPAAKVAAVPAARRRTWTKWAVPAAAAVVAAAIALFYLSREPARPEVVTMALAAPTRASAVPELEISHGVKTVRLALEAPTSPMSPRPEVTVSGPRGMVMVRQRPPASGDGGLVIELDAAALVPGLHDIAVGAVGSPVVVFQLRIVRR